MFLVCEGLAAVIKLMAVFNMVESIAVRKKNSLPVIVVCILLCTALDVANICVTGILISAGVFVLIQCMQGICACLVYSGKKRINMTQVFLCWEVMIYIDFFIQIGIYTFTGGNEWFISAGICRGIYLVISAAAFFAASVLLQRWINKNSRFWSAFLNKSYPIILILIVLTPYFMRMI